MDATQPRFGIIAQMPDALQMGSVHILAQDGAESSATALC